MLLDAFFTSELDQRHLLQKMIKSQNMTLKVLIDYCEDTHFDLQQTAKLFLESCLIQWEPYTPDEKEENTFGEYITISVGLAMAANASEVLVVKLL